MLRLSLLDGFQLTRGGSSLRVPSSSQRVLALLALSPGPVARSRAAFTLWADATEDHAYGSLRSALWRLRRVDEELVVADEDRLRLGGDVHVDLRAGLDLAERLLDGEDIPLLDPGALSGVLLHDWYDDWVLVERERFDELRVHALEALAERHLQASRLGRAIGVGLAAVAAEPLRESAHRVLIRAYLAEGNRAEALEHHRRYARRLRDEVGLEPSPLMADLLHRITER